MSTRKKKRRFKKQKRWAQYILIKTLLWLVALPPRKLSLLGAKWLAVAGFFVLRRDRHRTLDNLRHVFGDQKSEAELRHMGRQCFIHLAKNAVDVARFPQMSKADFNRLVTVDDLTEFDAAVERGKGLVALTGHIGNWELMAAWFSLNGYPVSVVGRRVYDPRLNDMLISTRESKGLKNIDRDSSARALWRVLRKGEVLGILIDQDTRVENVVVDFFGMPARTPVGVARLALRTGSTVIPLGIHRQADDRYHISFEPPILPNTDTDDLEQQAVALTQEFNHALERLILRDPSQWVWMHRRWRVKKQQSTQN